MLEGGTSNTNPLYICCRYPSRLSPPGTNLSMGPLGFTLSFREVVLLTDPDSMPDTPWSSDTEVFVEVDDSELLREGKEVNRLSSIFLLMSRSRRLSAVALHAANC